MKPNDAGVIEKLNAVLKNELTAINQYFLHSRMLKNWGLHRLADHEYQESVDEMKHADMLIERILVLEGVPNLQALGKIYVGETPEEIIACDLRLEQEAIPVLQNAIEFCESIRDYVSGEIFTRILESEEMHADWLETQIGLIERLGSKHYLTKQVNAPQ